MRKFICWNCHDVCGGWLCLYCWRMSFMGAIAGAVIAGLGVLVGALL